MLQGGCAGERAILDVEEVNSRLTTTRPLSLEMYLGGRVWGRNLIFWL